MKNNYFLITSGTLNQTNVYIYTYTPLELSTIVIISVSNPIILIQLYKRWKRKCALQQLVLANLSIIIMQ